MDCHVAVAISGLRMVIHDDTRIDGNGTMLIYDQWIDIKLLTSGSGDLRDAQQCLLQGFHISHRHMAERAQQFELPVSGQSGPHQPVVKRRSMVTARSPIISGQRYHQRRRLWFDEHRVGDKAYQQFPAIGPLLHRLMVTREYAPLGDFFSPCSTYQCRHCAQPVHC